MKLETNDSREFQKHPNVQILNSTSLNNPMNQEGNLTEY
jgi:hypothetical protein